MIKLIYLCCSREKGKMIANSDGRVSSKRHPIAKKNAGSPKKKGEEDIKKEVKEEECYEDTTEEEDSDCEDSNDVKNSPRGSQKSPKSSSDSDESMKKKKIDAYLNDVNRKPDHTGRKVSSMNSFQTAFESALTPKSTVKKMPNVIIGKKRKSEDGSDNQPSEKNLLDSLAATKKDFPGFVVKSEVVSPKKKSRKEGIPRRISKDNSGFPFLPLNHSNLLGQKIPTVKKESNEDRMKMLMPTIQWIQKQQLMQNITVKKEPHSDRPFAHSSGMSFEDLAVLKSESQISTDHHHKKNVGRKSPACATGGAKPSDILDLSPSTKQSGVTNKIPSIGSPTSMTSLLSGNTSPRVLGAVDKTESSANSTANNWPTPTQIKQSIQMTGPKESLFSGISDAFEMAQHMLQQKQNNGDQMTEQNDQESVISNMLKNAKSKAHLNSVKVLSKPSSSSSSAQGLSSSSSCYGQQPRPAHTQPPDTHNQFNPHNPNNSPRASTSRHTTTPIHPALQAAQQNVFLQQQVTVTYL